MNFEISFYDSSKHEIWFDRILNYVTWLAFVYNRIYQLRFQVIRICPIYRTLVLLAISSRFGQLVRFQNICMRFFSKSYKQLKNYYVSNNRI